MIGPDLKQTSGVIFRIQKYSIHDGPGIRTTVFFKGCPLECWWCHNPESISPGLENLTPAEGRIAAEPAHCSAREVSVDQVLLEVEKDRIFYEESGGGVTLSGGEPLLQPEFSLALATVCAERDLHVTLDTSGHGSGDLLEQLLKQVDLVLFDLKFADAARHKQYTGRENEQILNNLHRIDARDTPYRIRFPVIPGITDTPASLEAIGSTLAGLHKRPEIDLLPYHATAEAKYRRLGLAYRLQGLQPPSLQQLEAISARFRQYGLRTTGGHP